MIDSICRAEGYRTGLFISPHLVTFRERIRVNGEMIPEDAVANGLTTIRELVAKWSGDYIFTLDQVLKDMIGRCKELKLVAVGPERRLRLDFAIMLTVHTTSYVYRGREWHSM